MIKGTIQELFSAAAITYADRIAIERGRECFTYSELEGRSNSLANYLLASGASRGTVVAVLAQDSVEIITAMLAILKAGCIFTPLDPSLPDHRLGAMLAGASPQWLLVEARFTAKLVGLADSFADPARAIAFDAPSAELPRHDKLSWADDFASYRNHKKPFVTYDPDDVSYIYFTSGSTGQPKGIAGRLKGIDHFIRWEIKTLGLDEHVRGSQLITPTFDAFLRDVFVPLSTGGTVCVPPDKEVLGNAGRLVDWIDQARVSLIHCVPSLLRTIINEPLVSEHFQYLKHVLLSGEPLLPADVKRWMSVFGERVQLVNLYGPSETTMTKFFYFVEPSDQERMAIPIGQPMEGARAIVIDARGRACAVGTVGEICIRTPYRTHGYYRQPELTKEVFIPNPLTGDAADLVYKTGDLGRVLEDGNFEFLGRADQQVKIRGIRIELGEIVNSLRAYDGVRDVAVIDREDGSGNKYLCAYVVLSGETQPPTLRKYLARYLPDYMIPSSFVTMESLPRTLSGKIDRRALPLPSEVMSAVLAEYIAPRTLVEEVLADIWSRVLKVERVGINDNFFDLGGHSMLAMQLLSRVRANLGIEVPLRKLFETPTVAGLAHSIENQQPHASGASIPPLKAVPHDRPLPLSFTQQRLWFLDQMEPGNPFYNIPSAMRLSGRLDIEALKRSLNEIVCRHEVLRTTFALIDGQPRQRVMPEMTLDVPVQDLCEMPEHKREEEALRLTVEEAQRPFDLSTGPMLRVVLFRIGDDEHVMVSTVHHIVADGWSLNLLISEMATLYDALSSNRSPALPELPVQYADFALWQREWLQGEVLETQLAYWKRQLAGAPDEIALPLDHPRPAVQSFSGASHSFIISKELTESFTQLSHRLDCSLFMTLLAAFDVVLYDLSSQDDIVVGTPIANRNRVETENLIGCFLNTLVLRADLSGDPPMTELMRRVRETTLAAYDHQDLPLEKLVEALQPQRSLSRMPLFHVAFTLERASEDVLSVPGMAFKLLHFESGKVQFDLVLHLVQTDDGLQGSLQYSVDLFEPSTIARLAGNLETLLRSIVAHPDARLSELRQSIIEANMQQQLAREQTRFQKLKTARRKAITGERE